MILSERQAHTLSVVVSPPGVSDPFSPGYTLPGLLTPSRLRCSIIGFSAAAGPGLANPAGEHLRAGLAPHLPASECCSTEPQRCSEGWRKLFLLSAKVYSKRETTGPAGTTRSTCSLCHDLGPRDSGNHSRTSRAAGPSGISYWAVSVVGALPAGCWYAAPLSLAGGAG